MARYTLYAYADGSDLHDVAGDIELLVERFVHDNLWRYGRPWVVNQRRADDPSLRCGDLPDWERGLNFDLPDPPAEPQGWFEDVERVARFFVGLRQLTGRDFVIGIVDHEGGFSEDLFWVDSDSLDLGLLRRVIGVGGGD